MERKHKNPLGATIAAVASSLLTAANIFAIQEIVGLRRELSDTVTKLTEQVSSIQEGFQDSLEQAKEDLQGGD